MEHYQSSNFVTNKTWNVKNPSECTCLASIMKSSIYSIIIHTYKIFLLMDHKNEKATKSSFFQIKQNLNFDILKKTFFIKILVDLMIWWFSVLIASLINISHYFHASSTHSLSILHILIAKCYNFIILF